MGRANLIVVGSAVLVPLILGVEGYVLFGSPHRPRAAEVAAFPAAAAPDPLPAAALPIVPPPAEPAARELGPPPPDEAAPEPVAAAPEPETQAQQRELLVQHQWQIVRDADERVFDRLNLPEAQRAAIRAIDDQYVGAHRSLEAPGTRAAVADLGASQARRSAINDLLGAEGMRAFTFAERKAERRVRSQVRVQPVPGQ